MSDSENTSTEKRRYRRRSSEQPAARANTSHTSPTQLDLEALRDVRNADGLNQPIVPDDYIGLEEPEEQSLIGNPYMLAGFAVAAAIVLAVLVVVLFGGGSSTGDNGAGGGGDGSAILVDPLTPQASVTTGGIAAKVIAAAAVRTGPGTDFSEISPLRNGQDVMVIGRNADATWFQIDLGASLRGWVPATALKVSDEAARLLPLAVNTPIPKATPAPTQPPVPTATAGPATPTPAVTATATVPAGPDVALGFPGACTPGTPIVLIVRNAGGGTLTGRSVGVTLSNSQGVIFNGNVPLPDLAAGASATVATGQPATAPKMTARVSLFGSPADTNPANDNAECAVAGPIPPTASSGGLITPTVKPATTVVPTPTATRLPG